MALVAKVCMLHETKSHPRTAAATQKLYLQNIKHRHFPSGVAYIKWHSPGLAEEYPRAAAAPASFLPACYQRSTQHRVPRTTLFSPEQHEP